MQDLTRLESGNETSFNEPFNLQQAIEDATQLYRNESARRGLGFEIDMSNCPKYVVGDAKKIRTLVANLTANAGMSNSFEPHTIVSSVYPWAIVKYTESGKVTVDCHAYDDPTALGVSGGVAVQIVVADTGCGIPTDKLQGIFREFEQVEIDTVSRPNSSQQTEGLGKH